MPLVGIWILNTEPSQYLGLEPFHLKGLGLVKVIIA